MNMKRWLLVSAMSAFSLSACDCGGSGDLTNVAPHLIYDPQSLEFGEVPLGQSRTLILRLTNEGQTPLTLKGGSISSDTDSFKIVDGLPPALAPKQSIEFSVRFDALVAAETTGVLLIDADDVDGIRRINLRGIGVVPGIAVNTDGGLCNDQPGSLSFGTVIPGMSVTRTITLEATGSAPVMVMSAAIVDQGSSAEWELETIAAEGVQISQGQKLELTATYTPADSGADTAAFLFTTNVPNRGTIRIPACGAGAAPALCGTPVPLDMGRIAINVDTTGVLTLSNCATDPFDLTGLEIVNTASHPSDNGFSVATDAALPLRMEAGQTLEVRVKANSARLGMVRGWVRATTSATTQPEAFFPAQADVHDTCELLLAPSRLIFNNVVTGANQRRTVLMANNGADECNVRRIQVTTGSNVFEVFEAPSLPSGLVAGDAKNIIIRYRPENSAIPDNGILEVESGVTVHRVELLGNPMLPPGCHLELSQSFINWGAVTPGLNVLRGVELKNISEETCAINSAALDASSNEQFTNVQFQRGTLAPGETTSVLVNFRGPPTGTVSGLLRIGTDDVATPNFEVSLVGTAAEAGICVTPSLVDFGATQSGVMDFVISACGASPITVTDLAFTRPDPEISLRNPPAVPFVLQPGEQQAVTVLYESIDGVGDSGVLTVGSDDPVKPTVPVNIVAGPVIVPPTAGRYLYYWEIELNGPGASNIFRMPLQGQPTPEPYWGPLASKPCSGCHGVSPDGRYVAVVEEGQFALTVIDTQVDVEVSLPFQVLNTAFFTWKPDVNANPAYQFAYDDGERIHIASVTAGYLGELQGANDPSYAHKMPSWGANGKIAFGRGQPGGGWSFYGPCDIMLIDETGGVPVALNGAGGNGFANYYPAYHPSGNWVAFNQSVSAQGTLSAQDGRIKLAPTDQSGNVLDLPLLNGPNGQGGNSFPTWSLDGNFLSFSSTRPGGMGSWDLYIAPIDPVTGADLPAVNIMEANNSGFQHAARWSD